MNKDLYFIPILARAFQASDRPAALRQAFEEIQRLGQLEDYRVGLRQFHRFMAESYSRQVPTLRLEREGIAFAELIPCQAVQEARIPGIVPGIYSVRLDTGRLLWTGILAEADLLWAHAFPSAALPLAADSHEAPAAWTHELTLLQGEVIVRVYPGLEHGTIGIQIHRWTHL